jgi:hypothetical protein
MLSHASVTHASDSICRVFFLVFETHDKLTLRHNKNRFKNSTPTLFLPEMGNEPDPNFKRRVRFPFPILTNCRCDHMKASGLRHHFARTVVYPLYSLNGIRHDSFSKDTILERILRGDIYT